MTRVLRRPMFRMGGTAEGITSGLQPRQGYKEKGSVKQDVWSKSIGEFYAGRPTLGDIRDLTREAGFKPRGTNVYDFMTEMGLNLATIPSQGGILQQVAAASKDPHQRFLERKRSAAEQEYGSQSDLFKTFIEAGATATGEKSYMHRDKASMINENMDQQYKIYDQINALDPDDADYEKNKKKLTRDLRKLKEQISGEEFGKAQLQYWNKDENSRKLDRLIRMEIAKELGVDVDTTFEENKEFAEKFIKRKGELMKEIELGMSPTFKFATGGRVGYANAGAVMGAGDTQEPQPGERSYYEVDPNREPFKAQAPGPTDQGPAPEDMAGITYEELRARLPQEVSDDIVRLLANSAEALEDFAMIQTEQDINTFNKKYGVNLVLPSEG
jgi:hypothetical protein